MKQANYYNRSAHNLPTLETGETVRMKTPNKHWEKAVVLSEHKPRSYEIETESGARYRRNRRHIRKSREIMSQNENFDIEPDNLQLALPAFTSEHESVVREPIAEVPNINPLIPDVNPQISNSDKYVTRSGREVKTPARFKDFEH